MIGNTMIRKWKLDDIASITTLLNQLSIDLGESDLYEARAVKSHFHKMAKDPKTYETYVFILDKAVVGFISIVYYRSFFHKVGTALINELVVNRKYRNNGIGKELVNYAIKKAKMKKMDEIEVGVMKDNRGAVLFYKKNGFDEEYLLLGKEFK
jgi:ribosomal protein S18 acetylase RimI-like enzyme